MAKKMLINALHAEEARVAIVEDGRLVDLDVEIAGNEQIRGNIYKGVVVRVEPGLQAAFVDVGLKKLGFLQMGELHPENWKWREDIPEDQRHRRPRIQEVLRRGQELLVQVEKGERDNKGSALTTYVSLPGRYMVLMPGSDSSGISRKVEAEGERRKLKEIISEMTIPEGYGYIIRTEAMGRTREELQKDLDSLIALYLATKEQGTAMKGAGLIYQESALIIRTIRDYFSADIDEVLVDCKDVYKDVRECLKEIDPSFEKLVKMHQEKRPIFSRYQLEEQIDLIYEKKVPLKSGGSIFIEPTEALVSIDVNSGKSTGEKGVEDTAFKTNMEAAEEAARQLRLRDLGGLIVIDFIDMRERKHNAEVEKTLKSALKADKARVNVARISEFGLLEMSRQRIRQTLNQASTLECPHCDGRGKVKSVEAMALSFLRKVHAAAAKGTIGEVVGSLPLEVAYYLLNRKRHELSQIESDYDIEVTVKGKPSFLLNQMELELVKREKLPQEEFPPQEKAQVRLPAKEEAASQEAVAAEGRNKKKKKGKAKPQTEAEVAAVVVAEVVAVSPAVEPGGAERVPTAEGEPEEQKKKRRRKRKRGKGGAAEAAEHAAEMAGDHPVPEAAPFEVAIEKAPAAALSEATIEAALAAEPHAAPVSDLAGEPAGEEGSEEAKKKRRRKRRRGKGTHEASLHEAGEAGEEAWPHVVAEASLQADVPAAEAPETQAAPLETEAPAAPVATEGKKKRGRPARASKEAAEALPVAVSPETETGARVPVVAEPAQPDAKPQGAGGKIRGRKGQGAKAFASANDVGTEGETRDLREVSDTVELAGFAAAGAVTAVPDAATAADPAQVPKAPKAARAAKADKVDKAARAEKPAKTEKAAKADKTTKTAKTAKTGEADKTDKASKQPKAPRVPKATGREALNPVESAAPAEKASATPRKKPGRKPRVASAAPPESATAQSEPAEQKPKKTRAPRQKKDEGAK